MQCGAESTFCGIWWPTAWTLSSSDSDTEEQLGSVVEGAAGDPIRFRRLCTSGPTWGGVFIFEN